MSVNVGSNIKQLRIQKGISQKTMAKLIKKSLCNYYKKEEGQIRFSIEEVKTIANYFNVKLDDLFFDDNYSIFEYCQAQKA